jgi:hypothetical protein
LKSVNGRKIEKTRFSREKLRKKMKMNEKRKLKNEKIKFSQEKCSGKVLQGGYQICSDTML